MLAAPTDVVLAEDTGVQPGLLVARREDFTDQALPTPPLLAVEVLSPSTRLVDLNLKMARFERAGVASYWVVDPDVPRLVAWELREGRYVEVAGDEAWTASTPYAVTVRPSQLLD